MEQNTRLKMDKLLVIKIEDSKIRIFNEFGSCNDIEYDENFKIIHEWHSDDCEDFNDNARWLAKTVLEILKAEENDSCMHCDWSAEPEYEFNCQIKKKENNND